MNFYVLEQELNVPRISWTSYRCRWLPNPVVAEYEKERAMDLRLDKWNSTKAKYYWFPRSKYSPERGS